MLHRELSLLFKNRCARNTIPDPIERVLLLLGVSLVKAAEIGQCLCIAAVAFFELAYTLNLPVYFLRQIKLILLCHLPAPPFFADKSSVKELNSMKALHIGSFHAVPGRSRSHDRINPDQSACAKFVVEARASFAGTRANPYNLLAARRYFRGLTSHLRKDLQQPVQG